MIGLLCFVLTVLASPFKSKLRLEAENAVLRHQLMVLRRRLQGRIRLTNHDRWFFIQLYRWFPSILQVLTIIRPETLLRWHRVGFRFYWRWKSRHGAACLQDLMLKGPAGAPKSVAKFAAERATQSDVSDGRSTGADRRAETPA
jgi:hypothetical protein